MKYFKYFLENFFLLYWNNVFSFFIIVLCKLLFQIALIKPYNKNNFYNDITYEEQINETNHKLLKKVIWLMFDQYDFKTIKENINHLDNFKFLSEVSDNYINYSPNTVQTLKAIPSIILSKNFDDYEYEIHEGKIALNVVNKSLNLKVKFNEKIQYLNILIKKIIIYILTDGIYRTVTSLKI